jgi:hypothetical protein
VNAEGYSNREHFMNYVVVPIHGTSLVPFQRPKAAWMDLRSRFRTTLDLLGDVTVRPFRWSGRNSVRARAHAADQLRQRLQSLVDEFPEARLAIVAHSHGGNVALHALRDEALAGKIWGVACLGTPFLNVQERTLSRHPFSQLRFGALATVFLSIWYWLLPMSKHAAGQAVVSSPLWSDVLFLGVGLLTWVLAVVPVGIAWSVSKQLAEQVRVASQLPSRIPFRLLILCAEGDEASGLLGFTQAGAWLITTAWQHLGDCFGRFRERWRAMLEKERWGQWWLSLRYKDTVGLTPLGAVSVIALMVPLGVAVEWAHWHSFIHPSLEFPVVISPILLLWLPEALQALLGAVSLPFVLAGSLCYLGFGRAVAVSALHLDVNVTVTPPGEWLVCQLGSTDSMLEAIVTDPNSNRSTAALASDDRVDGATDSYELFRHSMLYDNPAAISRICRWLSEDA